MLCFSGRKLVCCINACKKHLAISFMRGVELRELTDLFTGGEQNTSIQSIRITSRSELNPNAFRRLQQEAVALDMDERIKPPPPKKREDWPMPDALAEALEKNKKAAVGFDAMKKTCQREYKVWISTAKQPETIEKRLKITLRARCREKVGAAAGCMTITRIWPPMPRPPAVSRHHPASHRGGRFPGCPHARCRAARDAGPGSWPLASQ
jgi:uncharacterized protein YdeI (YjbR/CyaY-like superfamily)